MCSTNGLTVDWLGLNVFVQMEYLLIHYFAHLFSDLPEIEVERSWVHSGEGYEAQLVCIVHAEPHADVSTL